MKAEEIKEKARKKEKLRKLRIDEWDLDIYYRRLTFKDEQELKTTGELFDDPTYAFEMVFLKTVDEYEKRIWTTEEDREWLRTKCPTKILTMIFKAIIGITIDDAKKNSKKIKT